jgi:solute carrier family 25 (mitochondrial folate transporter), member 32
MTMGGAAKVVASVVTYPYQVIKSRLQQRDQVLNTPRYQGVIHCARSILKYPFPSHLVSSPQCRHEGPHGFFKGLIPNCLKVAPNASLTFLVYEECLKLMAYLEEEKSR